MRRYFPALFLLIPAVALAQTTGPNAADVMTTYQTAVSAWTATMMTRAQWLFSMLALISFAWSAAMWFLERTDMQTLVAALIRKVMTIGFMYGLLINGPVWIPAIIASFEGIGQSATGGLRLAPDTIFFEGVNVAGKLLGTAGKVGWISGDFASALIIAPCAALIALSFFAIALQFMMAMIESYIVISAGLIFLGFGGSSWTSPYVERVLSYAVGIGTKIMVLYLIIGTGQTLVTGWLAAAGSIETAAAPAQFALTIMGSCLIYACLCWQVPRIAGAIMGGAPSLTGGDLLGTVVGAAAAGLAVASGGASLIGAAKSATTAAGAAGAGGATPPAPPLPPAGASGPAGTGGPAPSQPNPPASPAAPVASPGSAQPQPPGRSAAASARRALQNLQSKIPADQAHGHSGPQIPIHPHD